MPDHVTKIRGGKVEYREEHTENYNITHFQSSPKIFHAKLEWTMLI